MAAVAPGVQQLIAQHPQLMLQAATNAYQLQNQRTAQGYQGVDQITQGLLRAMGLYGDMQENKAARTERQDNRADYVAFRDKKYDADQMHQLAVDKQNGLLTDAKLADMALNKEITEEGFAYLKSIRSIQTDKAEAEFNKLQFESEVQKEQFKEWLLTRGDRMEGSTLDLAGKGQAIDIAGAQEERTQGEYDKGLVDEQRYQEGLAELDLTTPKGRAAGIPLIAEKHPELLAGLISGDEQSAARLQQLQATSKAKFEADRAVQLDPVNVEADVRGQLTKFIDQAEARLLVLQKESPSGFDPAINKTVVDLKTLSGAYKRILQRLNSEENPVRWDLGIPANTILSRMLGEELAAPPPPDVGGGTETAAERLNRLAKEAEAKKAAGG